MTSDELFIAAAREELREGTKKLEHCVAQLTDEQIWWRPTPQMNSIANLMLHLTGNLRQWIVAGIGGAKDVRNRPAEFSDDSRRPKDEILAKFKAVLNEIDQVLTQLTPEQLLSQKRIQGYDTNVTAAIFHAIPHFRGHVQEIIHMTRQQLDERYKFYFIPQGAEQTSAHGTPSDVARSSR